MDTMAATALATQGLGKSFSGVCALSGVDLDIRRGEVHSLCGENGAGKSTLIKCLSGWWPHGSYEGSILVDGQEARFDGPHAAEAAGIAVIHQELALVPEMTVAENIFLGGFPVVGGLVDWNRVYAETRALLERYGLDLDPAAAVGDLGIGQQQLVEIVKALAKDSRILLLDEPTAALTETEVDILLGIVRDLKARGIACVYISHKLDEVFAVSDRITVLRDGATVATLDVGATDRREVIKHMVGREITQLFPRRPGAPGEVRLAVEGLTVAAAGADDAPRLRDIGFEARAGEVLGIGGLMGSGRTELVMHLFGAYGRRMGGRVRLDGRDFPETSPGEAIKRGLMLVSEDRKRYGLVLDRGIGFNESLASIGGFLTHGLFLDHAREARENLEYFRRLRVKAPGLGTAVRGLSGGNQQKVVLAKALMTKPGVVFLDEPTRGIDVGAKQEVYELVNQLTDQGCAVVLVSSELPELMGMSDRMVILSEGRVGGTFAGGGTDQHVLLEASMKYHGRNGE